MLSRVCEAGGFTTKLRPDAKGVIELERQVRQLDSGFWFREHPCDAEWLRRHGIQNTGNPHGYGDLLKVEHLLTKAAKRAKAQRLADGTDKYVPKSMTSWMHNARAGTSGFLKALNSKDRPETTNDRIASKHADSMDPGARRLFQSILAQAEFSDRDELVAWSRYRKALEWHETNLEVFKEANSLGEWKLLGTQLEFGRYICDFLAEGGFRLPGYVPEPGSENWARFAEWLKDGWNISLDISPEARKRARMMQEVADRDSWSRALSTHWPTGEKATGTPDELLASALSDMWFAKRCPKDHQARAKSELKRLAGAGCEAAGRMLRSIEAAEVEQ